MANIDGYLSQIKTAVYGEDVRDSIYNAISAINNDTSSIMSTAKESIDNYIQGLEIYAYVDELPPVGNEQKIYAVQDSLEFENYWNNQYNHTLYPYNGLKYLPVYMSKENSADVSYEDILRIGETNLDRWKPKTLASYSEWSSTGNAGLIGGFIFKINSYEADQANITTPEFALYTVNIVAADTNSDNPTNTTIIEDVIIPGYSSSAGVLYCEDNWWLWTAFTNMPDCRSKADTSKRFCYAWVGFNEYIYNPNNMIFEYNRSYRSGPFNVGRLTNVCPLKLDDILSVAIDKEFESSGTYMGLVGIVHSRTPDDYCYMNDSRITRGNVDISFGAYKADTISGGVNPIGIISGLTINCNLTTPLQKIIDATYAGQLYLWNSQLNHYIALKSEAEVTTDNFLYQFIVTPDGKHKYPSDVNKWKELAENWIYLSSKGIVSTFKDWGASAALAAVSTLYLVNASGPDGSDHATFKYFGLTKESQNKLMVIVTVTLNCTTGTWAYDFEYTQLTSVDNILAGSGLSKTVSSGNVTLSIDEEYIPTGYTATIPANNWHSVAASTYATGITIANVSLDSSKNYLINVTAASSSRTDWLNNQVACSGTTGTNTFSFIATSEPQSDIDIYVTIQRINGSTVITQS